MMDEVLIVMSPSTAGMYALGSYSCSGICSLVVGIVLLELVYIMC